jgi:excisionase family DNA binding protein
MQAYATSERAPLGDRLRTFDRKPPVSDRQASAVGDAEPPLIDQVLGRLADLVVDRLVERTAADVSRQVSDWLDARSAAAYLRIHRDTLRKLAAQRAIPSHQDGPRCKLYFRRDELDEWRRSARPTGSACTRLRAVS